MIVTGANETIQAQLYYEWLNNLSMYQQQLEYLQQRVTGTGYRGLHLDASIELDALKELIKTQQLVIQELTTVVMDKLNQAKSVNQVNTGVMAFSEVIKNNQLREKIRKAEHSVFYLKHHVNKLLSIAS